MKYKKLLDDYLNGYDEIKKFLKNIPAECMSFKSGEESWTIIEHIIHIVDSEINNFIRWKSIIAQPMSKCFVINEENWTKNMNYDDADLNSYLDVFKLLRKITYNYLIKLEDNQWNKNYFIHEYQGKTANITLEKTIEIYKNHIYFHIDYIKNICADFKKRNH